MSADPQLRWLRLWTDVLEDPKLLLLSPDDRWYYCAILALKRTGLLDEGDPTDLRDRKISLKLRIDHRERDELKRRLMDVRLIDDNWQPLGWDKRQFSSDADRTAAERKRRQREKESHAHVTRDIAVTSRTSHGRVTTPESEQSRAETEQKRDKRGRLRASRVPEGFSPDLEFAKAQLPDMAVEQEAQKFRDWEFRTPRSDWSAAWRQWVQRCRETGRYAKIEVMKWE